MRDGQSSGRQPPKDHRNDALVKLIKNRFDLRLTAFGVLHGCSLLNRTGEKAGAGVFVE